MHFLSADDRGLGLREQHWLLAAGFASLGYEDERRMQVLTDLGGPGGQAYRGRPFPCWCGEERRFSGQLRA